MHDAKLVIDKDGLRSAFVVCKMIIIEETAQDAEMQYKKLLYVEFLEFLARIAVLYFEGSEMEELELHEKLEYLLDEILPIIEAKRVK